MPSLAQSKWRFLIYLLSNNEQTFCSRIGGVPPSRSYRDRIIRMIGLILALKLSAVVSSLIASKRSYSHKVLFAFFSMARAGLKIVSPRSPMVARSFPFASWMFSMSCRCSIVKRLVDATVRTSSSDSVGFKRPLHMDPSEVPCWRPESPIQRCSCLWLRS